jgi:hypothetical protein
MKLYYKLASIIIIIFTLIGCANNSKYKAENRKNNLETLNGNTKVLKSNKDIVSEFVENDLLVGIVINKMYPASNVIKSLGNIKEETIENGRIKYEGVQVNSIRKIEFDKYYAIVYRLDNGNEIFRYLLLKDKHTYKLLTYGTDLRNYVNLNGDSITRWANNRISIDGKYKDNWDMSVIVDYDDLYKIRRVEISIGGL